MPQPTIVILDTDQNGDPTERKLIPSPLVKGGTGTVIWKEDIPDPATDPEAFAARLHADIVRLNPHLFKKGK